MPGSPIISAAELRPLLGAADVRILGSPDLRILDARVGKSAGGAHLPGAIAVSLDRDLADPAPDPADGGRHPLPDPDRFARLLGAWGLTPATRVVVYDDQSGANAAARLWWLLRAVGHERVQILDGGLPAAIAAGLPLTDEPPRAGPAPEYPVRPWQLPTASAEQVDAARQDPTRLVLDARAPFRFRGESEPFDPVAGHIPGARNAPYADNLDASGRFKPAADLRALYAPLLGDVPPQRVIVHCGSGVTACHDLVALELAGLPGAALYVGSWSEWCRQPRPIATG
jgi:thiosulfate/3-mercaptopyruvate sulfurtransferase